MLREMPAGVQTGGAGFKPCPPGPTPPPRAGPARRPPLPPSGGRRILRSAGLPRASSGSIIHSRRDGVVFHRSLRAASGTPSERQAAGVTSSWVLCQTGDPAVLHTVKRLAVAAGVQMRPAERSVASSPGLVVLGADRLDGRRVPSAQARVPRVLVVVGEPGADLWRRALAAQVEQVISLPEGEKELLARLVRVARRPGRGRVIAVTGGCGGAGASVLAAALARTAAGITHSLLVEVDRLGSGADLLLGAEKTPGLRWPGLLSVRGELLPGSLAGLPVIDRLQVLSWDRQPSTAGLSPEAGAAVLAAAREEFRVVVLDLPRCLDEVAVVAARGADLGLLVVPAEVRAAVAARRLAAGLLRYLADLRLVVRLPGAFGIRVETVQHVVGLPLGGILRPEPGLRAALNQGIPPGVRPRGPLATFSRDLLARELREPVREVP